MADLRSIENEKSSLEVKGFNNYKNDLTSGTG